jgi:flagellar biosynthetic protein FliR
MIVSLATTTVFHGLMIFARIGSAFLFLPGLSEVYMNQRARLFIALGTCLILLPLLESKLPPLPSSVLHFALILAGEILIGAFLGLIAKILISTTHTLGMVLSFQTGLSAATLLDPLQGAQGSTIGALLSFIAMLLIFSTNLHHVFLRGIVDSYDLFQPGIFPPIEDMANAMTQLVNKTFNLAIQLSMPFIIMGLVLYLGAGVMGRLMPQMQVFFVLIPVQVLIGLAMLMMFLSAMMMVFLQFYGEQMGELLVI